MIFDKLSDQELVDIIMEIENRRARMDFTRPLFDRLKEVVEKEECVIITEKPQKGDCEVEEV